MAKYKTPKSIKAKEIQKEFWKIFLIEAGLFLISSALSLGLAFRLRSLEAQGKTFLPSTSLQNFLLSFVVGTIIVVALISLKNKKAQKIKPILYKGFFLLVCFWGGMSLLQASIPTFWAVAVMGLLLLWWMQQQSVVSHDILILIALAGAASFFGLEMNQTSIILLLVILSAYDFIAVYKTKHMVEMAKEMVDKKVVIGFIIPRHWKGFTETLDKVKPGGSFMILGGGDVVFPNILIASMAREGLLKALIVMVCALLGSFVSYYLFAAQKPVRAGGEREPIPALPPIALSSIIGYIITLLI